MALPKITRIAAPAILTLALLGLNGIPANAAATPAPATDIKTAVKAAAAQTGLGDKLSTWSEKNGVVTVGLTQVNGREASALKAKLGKNVEVVQQPRFEAATNKTPVQGKAADRRQNFVKRIREWFQQPSLVPGAHPPFIDSPAYKGGDRIVSQQTINGQSYIVQCTVTAPLVVGGATDMLTAGHCGAAGTAWSQGYWDGTKIQSSGDMGTAAAVSWENNKVDGALIGGGSYSPSITTPTGTLPVLGAATVAVGSKVCTDGSFTGYACGATVQATNVCANISDNGAIVTVCGLDVASAPRRIVQSGDSGGPVVVPASGGVQLAGTISAQANYGTTVLFSDVAQLQTAFSGTVAH